MPNLDLSRLHRFLVKAQETYSLAYRAEGYTERCLSCYAHIDAAFNEPHAPDCEWVALVEMTREH